VCKGLKIEITECWLKKKELVSKGIPNHHPKSPGLKTGYEGYSLSEAITSVKLTCGLKGSLCLIEGGGGKLGLREGYWKGGNGKGREV